MKTMTNLNGGELFCFWARFLILLFLANTEELLPQSPQSYTGSYVKTTIKSTDTYYPNPFPVYLISPKDTVLTGNSSLKIPFVVNYLDASFNGNFVLDFPAAAPLGLWETAYSNTNFATPLMLPVKLTGTLTLPAGSQSTTYMYSIQVISPYSLLSPLCSTAVKEVSDYKASPGTYNIDLAAICPIEILDHTNYYDYWAGSKFRFRFNPRISFYLAKAGSTYACNFGSNFETEYLFQRRKIPFLSVSPSSIELQTSTGDSARTRTLTVSNYGSDTLDYNAAISTSNGGSWLTISKNSGLLKGSGSENLFLKLDPGTLLAGVYTGSVTFNSVKADNTPVVVSVKMTLTSSRLQLKYDPPEIKLGEWTSLNISVVDQDGNLADTYDGGAAVNLLNETKEGLTNFTKTQSVLISKGKAQPLLIFTPDKSRPFDSVITNKTVLSGPIVIEVKPEDSQLKPDTAKMVVKSPIDFYIDSIEVQQGIVSPDKQVTLEYKPGVQKTFAARSFVAGHNTVVRAFVKYKKTTELNFNRVEYEMKGKLKITPNGSTTIGPFTMGAPGSTQNPPPFVLKDNYDLNEQHGMFDALFSLQKSSSFAKQGFYDVKAEIKYTSELDEKESEKENNSKRIEITFQESREFRVMAALGALKGEAYPNVPDFTWDYLKNVYPISSTKFLYTDHNSSRWNFDASWYDFSINYWNSLSDIFNRYNERSKPEYQCEKLVMFAASALQKKVAGSNAAGVAESIGGKLCVIDASNTYEHVVAHELGHLMGLKDTYDPYKVYNILIAPFACGDPNPRRSRADFSGNFIEEGNIDLTTLLKTTTKNTAYDFMGRASKDSSWIDRVTWDYLYGKFILSSFTKPHSASKYIAVSGMLKQSDSLTLNKLITLNTVPSIDDTLIGSCSVEFLNSSGVLLKKNNFNPVFFIPEVFEASEIPFNLYLTLPAGVSKIQITKTDSLGGKKILAAITFSANAPVVKFIYPTAKDSVFTTSLIKWTASDADKDKLTFDICYSPDGVKEYLIAVNLTDTVYQWITDRYPLSKAGYITVIANDGYNEGVAKSEPLVVTDVENGNGLFGSEPEGFRLEQCYPNPFNPATTIAYSVPVESRVKVVVYNLIGQIVGMPESAIKQAGNYKTGFDAKNLPSGIYFYSLRAVPLNGAKEFYKIMKMVLLK